MNKKKSLEKLEDGKEEDGEKNTKELDDIKGEKKGKTSIKKNVFFRALPE